MILVALTALADIGPPPTCPAGTHNEYLMGNRCVRDGYRLEQAADGSVQEVAEPALPAPAPSPAPTPAPTPEVTPAPEAKKCATSPEFLGVGFILAGLLAARRR